MRKFSQYLPYYLVIFFFYWPLYELFLWTISVNSTLKELYISNVIIFSPLVTFIVSLCYSCRFKFSLWWLLGIGLLFCFTIIPFGEFIWIYFLAYEIFALAGMSSGLGIKYLLQKRKNKKLSQNP
ncbi:hypothetical protein [Streptococcus infantis]|uniref:hypothetical protein n=1 Tax=Streptococcus infantis TaxID=68892 RepID=UPI0024811A41|nr:hypothetical protein [Streptococcus infantis]MDH9150165.1 hypothetical protein [Streptococcus infantis]